MTRSATYVLDSSVLIDHLGGHLPAREWLAGLARNDTTPSFACSVITSAELLSSASPESAETVSRLLSVFKEVPVDAAIARTAADYVRTWGPNRGVNLPDAIVAATAKLLNAPLVTRDKRRFPMEDIEVLTPY